MEDQWIPLPKFGTAFERTLERSSQKGQTGFAMSQAPGTASPWELLIQDGEYVVSYEAWHEHFDEAISAIRCFAFGLSKTCRLKIISRGKQPHKWIVESLQDSEWVVDSTMGLMIYPFWRKPRVEYRQNPLM